MAAAASNGGYNNEYMVCLVNKARAQNGAPALGINQDLTSAAQQHSTDMARSNNMDHTGSDGSSPGDRCQKAGFNWSAVAENIAFGQDSMDSVMQSWLNSPGHRENIMNPEYTMMGSAVAYSGSTPYYTQDFGCNGQPATNIPSCNGNYQSMSSGGGSSQGGGSMGGGGGGSYGGNDSSSGNDSGSSYGGSSGGDDSSSGGDNSQQQDMSSGGDQSQSQGHGGHSGHHQRRGGHSKSRSQSMQGSDDSNGNQGGYDNGSGGGSYGNGDSNDMGSSRGGHHGGHHGGFSSSNSDWFSQQGFGQSPYGSGQNADDGGFGGMGGIGGMGGGRYGGGGHMGGFNGGGF